MVKTGSINMAKAIRRIGHRSGQARKMTFYRDAIETKDNYGVEIDTVASGNEGLTIPNIDVFIAPIITSSDNLTRAGHTTVGAASLYIPSLSTIKNNILGIGNDGVHNARLSSFNELESKDILYDMEKIINYQTEHENGAYEDFGSASTGRNHFEGDRMQVKIKNNSGTGRMTTIVLEDNQGGGNGRLTWTFDDTSNPNFNDVKYHIVDLPVSGVSAGDKAYYIYVPASGATAIRTLTASITNNFDIKDCDGETRYLEAFNINAASGGSSFTTTDLYIYKAGEWRIEDIKEYRDEYMELGCTKIRGEKGSLRRAYADDEGY